MDSDRCEGGLGVWSGSSLPPRWEHRDSQDSPEYLCRVQGFPARIQSADEIISIALLPAGNMEFTCSSTSAPRSWGAQMRLGMAGSGHEPSPQDPPWAPRRWTSPLMGQASVAIPGCLRR